MDKYGHKGAGMRGFWHARDSNAFKTAVFFACRLAVDPYTAAPCPANGQWAKM
jgi:hypothetical protein